MQKNTKNNTNLTTLIASYEVHHLKSFLAPHHHANVLILGDEIPTSIWSNSQWHGILAIHQASLTKLSIPQIKANYHELPLLADSIDFVIVYHALDFVTNTEAILKELWRVLAPEGKIIILGYNPKALFGLPKSVVERFQNNQTSLPVNHLLHKIKQQGFAKEHVQTFCFMPPLAKIKLSTLSLFIENIGKFFWPSWGIIYLIVGTKPLLTLTPVKKTKKPKMHFAIKGLAAHTQRSRVK